MICVCQGARHCADQAWAVGGDSAEVGVVRPLESPDTVSKGSQDLNRMVGVLYHVPSFSSEQLPQAIN